MIRGFIVGKSTRLSLNTLYKKGNTNIKIGDSCVINSRFYLDKKGAIIKVGNRVYIGKSTLISAERVEICDDVVISWGVTIVDHNSHSLDPKLRKQDVPLLLKGQKDWTGVITAPVKIGKGAWIGFGASILKGVTIGNNAVIGANSVVTKDIPDGAIAAGNPARVIKFFEG